MKKNEPGMNYNMKTLNKVFAVLSIIFLFATLWMFLDDFIRPWKAVQIKALEIQERFLASRLVEADESIDKTELNQIKQQMDEAEEAIKKQSGDLEVLQGELAEVEKKIYIQNMKNGQNGSFAGEFQFKYEHAMVEGHHKAAKKYKVKMDDYKAKFEQGRDDLKTFQSQANKINKEIAVITGAKEEAEKELTKLTNARDLLMLSYNKVQKDPVWLIRNAPFLDFLDPTLKIHQYVIDNVTDDRYFQQVPKVDRCQTCHTFIDQPGYENQENPYKTHPNLDTLAVGRTSAHPAKEFGCTSCHNGEGHKVFDFNAPEHTPQNEAQKQEWIAKYNWREAHKVLSPMLPLNHTEASCVKCHKEEWHYSMGTQVNQGKELVKTYGCYGCHVIPGFEEQPKPAPSLYKVSAKVSKEWMKNWIWSPHAFNPHSKMPAYFNQVNNQKPEFMMKNVAEVNAMAEYIYESSQNYEPLAKYTIGSAERGKELIQTVGCIGCHQVEGIDEPYNKVKSRAGAYLTGTGSKVDPNWLVSWLTKPSHYQEDTIMPSFRLSAKEANDIATYLLSLKNKDFEQLKFNELDKNVRDELLIDYFAAFDPVSFAKEKLAKMSDHERTMELGKRSIGKYGCYSCHDIVGFEPDRAPIGPNLEHEGSKPLTQFGYGQQHDVVGHSRHEWIYAHLKEPARWDIGVPKAFGDLNKMPNFYLTDKEAEAITTYIIGNVSSYIPKAGQKILNEREKVAEIGKKIVVKYNCQGCHAIDGVGGDITAAYEDDLNQGPPYLVGQGHRVHTDWLYQFLKQVHPIRPYVGVRMPSFHYSNDELNKIVNYFRADSEQPIFEEPIRISWEPGEREAAKKMWNELACTSCHTGGFVNEEAQGPNLHFVKKRLRPSWIKKWLTDPTAIMPYTVMPNFWEGGTVSAVEGVLDNDPKRQIEAMTKFILEFAYDRSPEPFPYQGKELRSEKDMINSSLSSMEK